MMSVRGRIGRVSLGVALSLAVGVGGALAAPSATHVWTRLRPALPAPPRAAMTMAYDPVSGYVVTFGGYDSNIQYLNQTWIWDGVEWAQPIVQTPPPPRAAAGMAYDEVTHQLVLYGGYDGSAHLGDTWTWNGADHSWTERHPGTRTPRVSGPMLFTDPATGHVDMVGGFDGQFFQNTTYRWTGSDWRKLDPPSSITARGAAIGELDRANHTVVVFSGLGDLNTYDTWTWDGSTWTRQSPAHQPPARFYSASAYSPRLHGVVVFGGGSGSGDLNDTWEWNGSDWRRLRPGPPPARRESQGMTYDGATRMIVMFGGQVHGVVAGDTWGL